MSIPRETYDALEGTFGLLPDEVDDVAARMGRGESDEQLAEFLAGSHGRGLSQDQYLNAVRTIRTAVDKWRYSVGVKRGGDPFVHLATLPSLELARGHVQTDSRAHGQEAVEFDDGPERGQWVMRAGEDAYLIERVRPGAA